MTESVWKRKISGKSAKLIKRFFFVLLMLSALSFPIKNITNTHVLYAKISDVPTE